MNFYSFSEIRERGNCIDFAEHLGCTFKSGRCQALWRGGDGFNVAVEPDRWFDHKTKQGGGIMDLCMTAKYPGDIQAAQNYLGEWLHLEPKQKREKNPTTISAGRYDELVRQGYVETKRYTYKDLDGEIRHFVARLHHPTKGKEFIQGTPQGWGLKGVTPILYRLKDWVNSTFVCIVEGEKDADTVLDKLKLPATTNCGGSEKWRPEYSELFRGKNVVILRDNDEAGEKHATRVARELRETAKNIFVINLSKLPKGDITDWVEKEGGTKDQLLSIMKQSKPLDKESLNPVDPAVQAAKQANQTSFSNFTEEKEQIGSSVKVVKRSRQINALIEDTHTRFIGFPRRVGGSSTMFDHDRMTGDINYLHGPSDLFAWIGRKSKQKVSWAQADSMVTKSEFFQGLLAEARTYEAISNVPDWPKRDDVYYAHPPLPKASPGFQYFNDFVDFFNPASQPYKTFLKAFICAPMWYVRGLPRPGWIIDSTDGAGTGKTTLVELVARLYDGAPIRTNKQELKTNVSDIIKRLVSTEGRLSKILLADNITGSFHCSELSDFMTAESISGKAPYGRGEETRPNNLTYVITANSATVDNDLSDRCYFIHVCKPKRTASWKSDIINFLEKYRFNVLADIIGMLESRREDQFDSAPQTRFPEFEETILQAVCEDEQEYAGALATLGEARSASNNEDDDAKTIIDEFTSRLIEVGRRPGSEQIWIQSSVAKQWVREIFDYQLDEQPIQYLRNLAKNGLAPCFDAHLDRYPHNGEKRRRGIMWNPENYDGSATRIIGIKGRKVVEII
jgi:5S rRNA maturation endonuclease (ribonuclease M5)